jgi:phospholipid/cholesterol/gamma-HCH transport system ATP-binding protein
MTTQQTINDGAVMDPYIRIKNLEMRYGSFLIQRDLTFEINRGDVFIIMGGSGCGKSTLLKHLIGLYQPVTGSIHYGNSDLWGVDEEARRDILRNVGILYQQGALWSSLTLCENIAVPLSEYTNLSPSDQREMAALKLSLVGLAGFEDFYPSEISGGMRKRAALARAIALDPDILFFDEPSAGLDPISARLLDDLILELSGALGTTVVIVTHELASIFAVASNSVFLDADTKTMLATGDPKHLRDHSPDTRVQRFLLRGEVRAEPH